jgi:hypothetical protein
VQNIAEGDVMAQISGVPLSDRHHRRAGFVKDTPLLIRSKMV